MTGTPTALQALTLALRDPESQGVSPAHWRWMVRGHLGAVRDALANEHAHSFDGWLSARGGAVVRERDALLLRLAALGPAVLESPELDTVRADLKRLATDIAHHCQRLHDLAYDEVELELGGSE